MKRKIICYFERTTYANPRINQLMKVFRFWIWFLSVKLRSSVDLNVNKIIWVNPRKIEYVALELNPNLKMGMVIGGNWDKSNKKFEELNVYQSFRRRFLDGDEWSNTSFYNFILKELKNDKLLWGCRNKDEVDARFKKIDNLYYDIKTHGYKSGKEIVGKNTPFYDPMQSENEVTINIGREGNLLFNDGRHRLSIAKLLKLKKIPVKVVIRHPEWMKFRKEIIAYAKKNKGKLYQPLTHPDLQDIPSTYGHIRYNIIKMNLFIKKGKVLDIGAYLGYFCNRFEDEDFDCYAVENDPMCIYFLKKLKKIENKKFKIISESIFNYNRGKYLSYDIVLALNIFHHFLKSKESFEELIGLLKRIKVKEMFFQSHNPDEPQMKYSYKNFNPEEFAQFISKYVNLQYKIIGKTEDNRTIFKFFN